MEEGRQHVSKILGRLSPERPKRCLQEAELYLTKPPLPPSPHLLSPPLPPPPTSREQRVPLTGLPALEGKEGRSWLTAQQREMMTLPQGTEPTTPTHRPQRGVSLSFPAQKSWEVRIPNPSLRAKKASQTPPGAASSLHRDGAGASSGDLACQ